MKKHNNIFIASLALLSLAACADDDYVAKSDGMVRVEARIAPQTRVNSNLTGDTWDSGDKIFVSNVSTNAVTGKKDGVYAYNGTAWSQSLTTDYPNYVVWADGADGTNSFEAFYPYDAAVTTTSYTAFTLPEDQSTADKLKAADYMTASASAAEGTEGKLSLNFKHEMVKVRLRIVEFKNRYAAKSPNFDVVTFNLPATQTSSKTITLPTSNKVTALKTDGTDNKNTYTAILAPGKYDQGSETNFFAELTDNNFIEPGTAKKLVERFTIKGTSILTEGLVAGKAYTFDVTVGKDTIYFNNVHILDWQRDTIKSGTAENSEYLNRH